MKKLLCLTLALALALSVITGACAAFDPSVFQGNEGYSYQEKDGSWICFRGIVFNDIREKRVQLSVQADGSGGDSTPALRLFALVTNSREKSVSEYGTPAGISLEINGEKQADIRLNDRYGNPACASAALGNMGEELCRLLSDVSSLSFGITFEGNEQVLSYELNEQDIAVFRRTVGNLCGSLPESGIFDVIREDGSADDGAWITITEIPADPEDKTANTPEPTAALTPEPTAEPTAEPTPEPTAETTPEPTTEATAEPAAEPTQEATVEPPAESDSVSQETTRSFSGIRAGDTVRMGHYEQTQADLQEPIEWQVLRVDKKAGKALLLSVRALDAVSFGEAANPEEYTREGLNWENSHVRNWLNSEFYLKAFSEDEKEQILGTALRTKDKAGSHHTADRVFLLNAQEVRLYLKKAGKMTCIPTAYARAKLRTDSQAVSPEGYCCWMLRELVKVPTKGRGGIYQKGTGNEVGYVNQNHGLKLFNQWVGCPVWQDNLCAIRPAMWVRIR